MSLFFGQPSQRKNKGCRNQSKRGKPSRSKLNSVATAHEQLATWSLFFFLIYVVVKPASHQRRNRKRKRKKKENFVFLVLVLRLRLCQKSSSVKRQNVSAITLRLCLRRQCEAGLSKDRIVTSQVKWTTCICYFGGQFGDVFRTIGTVMAWQK